MNLETEEVGAYYIRPHMHHAIRNKKFSFNDVGA